MPTSTAARSALLLGGAALVCSLTSCKRTAKPSNPPAAEVSVISVQPRSVDVLATVPGRTVAYRVAEVRPQVSGVLLKRMFEEGTDVTEGQQLYQIDPAPYQAAYNKAKGTLLHDQAALVYARAHAARQGTLGEEGWVSKDGNDQATAAAGEAAGNVEMDQAALNDASINLTYTKVLSPIAGRIGRSAVTEGALVTANQSQALATVMQLDPIYVDVTQSSADLLPMRRRLQSKNLNAGGNDAPSVDLTLEDGRRYGRQGKLAFSEVSVDPSTGTMTLRAVFPNPDHLLLPGMYVHATIQEGTDQNAYLVPQNAVGRNVHADPLVLVVNERDVVEERMVELDGTRGESWVVTKGITPGDRIITEGIQRVSPGAHVHPTHVTPQPHT
jgi:membrane fusion protein (multidrug efflux system)